MWEEGRETECCLDVLRVPLLGKTPFGRVQDDRTV